MDIELSETASINHSKSFHFKKEGHMSGPEAQNPSQVFSK